MFGLILVAVSLLACLLIGALTCEAWFYSGEQQTAKIYPSDRS